MRVAVLSICALLSLVVFFLILESTTGWLNFKREEDSNRYMAQLRDRARKCPPDASALSYLISVAKSKDSVERTAAIGYLGQVGSNAAPSVSVLIETLNGENPFDAREAATSLGEVGPSARRAIPDLIKAVQEHPSEDIGWLAAQSLGHIATSNDIKVVTTLKQAAKSPNELMRNSANEGLKALGLTIDN